MLKPRLLTFAPMKPISLPGLLALTALLSQVPALAQTEAVSNLGNPPIGGKVIRPSTDQANAFTTGTSIEGSVRLISVVLRLDNPFSTGSGFSLNLYSDNAIPDGGTLIATLAGSDPIGNPYADYTYTAPANTFLADNTSYWLVASTSSGEFRWEATTDLSETGLVGWSISNDSQNNAAGSWRTDFNLPSMFAVNISPVPEPSTYAAGLAVAGLVGATWWRRRRSA